MAICYSSEKIWQNKYLQKIYKKPDNTLYMSCWVPFNDFRLMWNIRHDVWWALCGLNVAHHMNEKILSFLSFSLSENLDNYSQMVFWLLKCCCWAHEKKIMSCNNRRSHVELHLNSIKYSSVCMFALICVSVCALSFKFINVKYNFWCRSFV